ncbi:MAG TPA: hypothetical protein VIK75_09645 [Calditerricola sp.]
MLAKLRSRKFLAALLTALYIVLTDGLGLNIPQHVYEYLKDIVLFYIGVEGAIDLGRALAPALSRKQEAA